MTKNLARALERGATRPCRPLSASSIGRHATGLATQRSMSDSLQPAPLTLILIWGGNVPSAILR